jgi:hypothetical protein
MATISTCRERLAVITGLRWWAQGVLADQAAVELLAYCFDGRHAHPGVPWIRPCARPGWYWLDADTLAAHAATLTGDEKRVLTLAAALVGGDPWTRRRWVQSRRAAA